MARAFVFPGQGSQVVGMGRELCQAFEAARLVLEEVDEALNQRLSKLMFEGPERELMLTENAQPALMAASMAAYRVLAKDGALALPQGAACVAGHSLGEYSALAAAGTFMLADAARLLKARGQAMQKAVPVGEGAMAALLGVDLAKAEEIVKDAAEDEVLAVANDNAPGQVVVSGHKSAVERAVKLAGERGPARALMLPVSAPFHCSLMQPAADAMAEALSKVAMEAPAVPLVANVTASAVSDVLAIRNLLVAQVTARVRWRECVLAMKKDDVDTIVEIGSGKVLSGLTRRIAREINAVSIQTPADIDAFLKTV